MIYLTKFSLRQASFQPLPDQIFWAGFFTTKPIEQGTGLGLSLAYDIVKADGGTIIVNTFNDLSIGEIKVKTKEKEFAEFIIHLPAS